MSFMIKFNSDKCIGCYACHTACIAAHHGAEEINARSFRAVKKVVQEAENFQKNICPGCMHCGACMKVCGRAALYREQEKGFILVKPEECIGCGECVNVCPIGVIFINAAGKAEKCDGCMRRIKEGREPACVRTCFSGAITLEKI